MLFILILLLQYCDCLDSITPPPPPHFTVKDVFKRTMHTDAL